MFAVLVCVSFYKKFSFHVEFGSGCYYNALVFLEYKFRTSKNSFEIGTNCVSNVIWQRFPANSHPHIEVVTGNRITRITFEHRIRISNSNWAGRWHEDAHCRENDRWFLFKLNFGLLRVPQPNEKVCMYFIICCLRIYICELQFFVTPSDLSIISISI